MNTALNVVVDQRFKRTADGRVWTHTPPSYEFFQEALNVFGRLRIIARTIAVDRTPEKARPVNGPNVEVIPVPSFVGPLQYLRKRREIAGTLRKVAELDGAFLMRIPSQTAFVLADLLDQLGRPYASELLTDPHDFFAAGVAPHGMAYLFRPYFCFKSREVCARAVVANYITGTKTRKANPALSASWSSSVSDVELSPAAFAPRKPLSNTWPLEVVTVGFFDLLYKGQDVLIRALAECSRRGLAFRLTFVGDGQSKGALLRIAEELGVAPFVEFTGALGGASQVREYLDRSHLFALPSRAEGIPRALLEAMAAGMPAIGSNVGAMPDLLDPRWIVEPGSVEDLASKIMDFARAPEEWAAIGARNREVSRSFEAAVLVPQRIAFYGSILKYGLAAGREVDLREVIHAA